MKKAVSKRSCDNAPFFESLISLFLLLVLAFVLTIGRSLCGIGQRWRIALKVAYYKILFIYFTLLYIKGLGQKEAMVLQWVGVYKCRIPLNEIKNKSICTRVRVGKSNAYR
jgi:hypothetical protein